MLTKLDIQVAEAQLTSEPFPAEVPKPLPEGLCVNYFSVVVVRYHGNLQKQRYILIYGFRGIRVHHGREA